MAEQQEPNTGNNLESELYRPLTSNGMNVFDIMKFHGMDKAVELVKNVLSSKNAEIERLREKCEPIDNGGMDMLVKYSFSLQDKVQNLQANLEQARIFIKALDVKKLIAERDSLRKKIADLERYKEQYIKWHNIAQDICVVFGDSTYTYVAMEGWIKKMCNDDVSDRYLALAEDVCNRMLKIMPHEWDDPECGEPWTRLKQKD